MRYQKATCEPQASVEPLLDQYKPPGLIKKIYFRTLTFGDAPFKIDNVWIDKASEDEVCLEVRMQHSVLTLQSRHTCQFSFSCKFRTQDAGSVCCHRWDFVGLARRTLRWLSSRSSMLAMCSAWCPRFHTYGCVHAISHELSHAVPRTARFQHGGVVQAGMRHAARHAACTAR